MDRYKNMSFKGVQQSLFIVGFMSLIMGGFQNCAEQPLPTDEGGIAIVEGGMVQIVDQWYEGKLVFVESNFEVDEVDTEATLQGFCQRQLADGEIFDWNLVTLDGQSILLSGDSVCTGGGFQVNLDNIKELSCDESYKVHVQSSDGHEDVMFLTKVCSS